MAEVNVYVNRYADYARVIGERPSRYGDRGFVSSPQNGIYMVFINERDDIDEQIHTLAHECAHIALGHIGPDVDAEEQAERLSCFILGFAKVMAREHQHNRRAAR